MNMNMYVYRVAEKQDSGSAGEPGENHPNGRSWLTTALSRRTVLLALSS